MEVYLTIDTECSEERFIRGQVRPPLGYELMMRGRFDGQANGFGTDLIVRELGRYDFRATFFVEPLCAGYFGIDGLSSVCRDLIDHGHDIQLHLHPNFKRPEWRRRGLESLEDNIGAYELRQQEALLAEGLTLLSRAGVSRDTIVAFRAGNYGANNLTWQALTSVGLSLDSSFNLWAVGQDCHCVVDRPRVDLFEALPGLWELPISCFREGNVYRHLEITAISAREMIAALIQLERSGARTAAIITHPGEFFVVDDHVQRRGRPNMINISRLRRLLTFLDRHRDRFAVRTVRELVHGLRTGTTTVRAEAVTVPDGSRMFRLLRAPVQAVKKLAYGPRGLPRYILSR